MNEDEKFKGADGSEIIERAEIENNRNNKLTRKNLVSKISKIIEDRQDSEI